MLVGAFKIRTGLGSVAPGSAQCFVGCFGRAKCSSSSGLIESFEPLPGACFEKLGLCSGLGSGIGGSHLAPPSVFLVPFEFLGTVHCELVGVSLRSEVGSKLAAQRIQQGIAPLPERSR